MHSTARDPAPCTESSDILFRCVEWCRVDIFSCLLLLCAGTSLHANMETFRREHEAFMSRARSLGSRFALCPLQMTLFRVCMGETSLVLQVMHYLQTTGEEGWRNTFRRAGLHRNWHKVEFDAC